MSSPSESLTHTAHSRSLRGTRQRGEQPAAPTQAEQGDLRLEAGWETVRAASEQEKREKEMKKRRERERECRKEESGRQEGGTGKKLHSSNCVHDQ